MKIISNDELRQAVRLLTVFSGIKGMTPRELNNSRMAKQLAAKLSRRETGGYELKI